MIDEVLIRGAIAKVPWQWVTSEGLVSLQWIPRCSYQLTFAPWGAVTGQYARRLPPVLPPACQDAIRGKLAALNELLPWPVSPLALDRQRLQAILNDHAMLYHTALAGSTPVMFALSLTPAGVTLCFYRYRSGMASPFWDVFLSPLHDGQALETWLFSLEDPEAALAMMAYYQPGGRYA